MGRPSLLQPFRWVQTGRPWQTGVLILSASMLVACGVVPHQSNADTYERQLANYLTSSGAIMYGAYWCPHCADQKAMFHAAVKVLPYVECDPKGENAQPQRCQDRGIEGYPTWEIHGQLYPGVRSLDELADLSGFTPPH